MKFMGFLGLVFCGVCFAEDPPPVRIQMILSSDVRATLDPKKVRASQELLKQLPPGTASRSLDSLFRKPIVTAIPDQKFPQNMYIQGMSRETCRLLFKPFGTNRFTLDSVRRGDLNTVGAITIRPGDPLPEGVQTMEFQEAGRRYVMIWNRERLAEELEISLDAVDRTMPDLAKTLASNLKVVVAAKGEAPAEIREQQAKR